MIPDFLYFSVDLVLQVKLLLGLIGPLVTTMYESNLLMLMEFPNLAFTSVSLRGIFWLYTSKDGSGASLADLLDLAVLLP